MELQNLPKSEGISRRKKRRGIGVGTGNGKTSGRGHKGQKSRSGSGIPAVFEGGQMPLARKLPFKRGRGFTNYLFKKEFAVVNVSDLEKLELSEEINHESLVKAGLINKSAKLLKVLGDGEITKSLTVKANAFTSSAKEKIEKAGGKAITL